MNIRAHGKEALHLAGEWAEKGLRKEDHVLPWQRCMVRDDAYGVYFIFKSMEQGPSFRVSAPKYATKDPNYRILARQRSRFTHYYFYLRDLPAEDTRRWPLPAG